MNPKLVDLVKCAECLIQDTKAYQESPENYHLDGQDIQMLHSVIIDHLLGWYTDSEEAGTLTGAEGLIVFSTAYQCAIVQKSKFTATSSARESALPRISRHLSDSSAMATLHAAELDIWVALLVVTMAGEKYQDQFWKVWLETLARQQEHPIQTFEDLKHALNKGIWVASSHDIYAECVWDETLWEWTRPRGIPQLAVPKTRSFWSLAKVSSTSTTPNPYVNFQTLAWAPIEQTESEYGL